MAKKKFYTLDDILALEATYNMIIGEKGNGKSYAAAKRILQRYSVDRTKGAWIRRYERNVKGREMAGVFDNLIDTGDFKKITGYDGVKYVSKTFYPYTRNASGDKVVSNGPEDVICKVVSVENEQDYAGKPYKGYRTLVYDEFLSRDETLIRNEFRNFQLLLDTIIRQDYNGVEIYMLGNTVNQHSLYFEEMGINHIRDQKQGTIETYDYGDSGLKVAVEYCGDVRSKEQNKYFAFDNPHLKMLTTGAWEMDIYPHCPQEYSRTDVVFTFYIVFDRIPMQCDVIDGIEGPFIFIHPYKGQKKVTEITDALVYSTDYSTKPNFRRRITQPVLPVEKKIAAMFKDSRVFYNSNQTGDLIWNYLTWCKNN